ncbi:hypothetical protein QZH41_002954 [Actinostola sp. cb2023]|nr:hypothetical protein QZH41_002954 [Actinostola sp. cb2023]
MPKYADELYAALVLSQRSHAKITSIDTTEATSMPGVRSYVSVDDVTGANPSGSIIPDELVFYTEEVTSTGQVIGAILAETQAQAQRAAKAVKVEYVDLPSVITIEDAIKANSFVGATLSVKKGDVQKGFADSDHVIEGEMRTGAQGDQSMVVSPQGDQSMVVSPQGDQSMVVSPQGDQSMVVSPQGDQSHGSTPQGDQSMVVG